jgi:O-antigen/teichoic acid export membrane protein
MQIRTTRTDVIWNYAGTIVSAFSSFLLLPFLIFFLNSSELGLWYVYLAIGNLVMLFEFGFTPTFSRNFTFCWSGATELTREGCIRNDCCDGVDAELMAHLIAVCKTVYRRVALIGLVVLLIPGTVYIASIVDGLDITQVFLSWFIFSSAVLLNLYFLWYASALRGIGAIAADNQIMIAAKAIQLLLSIILLFAGYGLIGVALGFLGNALVYRILGSRKFWHDDQIKILNLQSVVVEKNRAKELFKVVSYNAFKDGGVMIANYASTQASSLLCSTFLGLAQAGAFSIALQFATAIGNMARAYMTSCNPMIQSAYRRGDKFLVRKTFSNCVALYVVVSIALYIAVLLLIYPLLNLFKPDSNFDPLIFSGVMAYMFLFNWFSLFGALLSDMNTIPYVNSYVAAAILGVLLSSLLTAFSQMGAWGLILGLALPQCVYNVWKWPRFASEKIDSTPICLLATGLKNSLNLFVIHKKEHR